MPVRTVLVQSLMLLLLLNRRRLLLKLRSFHQDLHGATVPVFALFRQAAMLRHLLLFNLKLLNCIPGVTGLIQKLAA